MKIENYHKTDGFDFWIPITRLTTTKKSPIEIFMSLLHVGQRVDGILKQLGMPPTFLYFLLRTTELETVLRAPFLRPNKNYFLS